MERRKLDIIFTMDWDIADKKDVIYEEFEEHKSVFVVSKQHPLAGTFTTNVADLKDYVFVLPGEDESVPAVQMFLEGCKRNGFVPKLKKAASMEEQNLWMEAGFGIGNITTTPHIYHNINLSVVGDVGLNQMFVFA